MRIVAEICQLSSVPMGHKFRTLSPWATGAVLQHPVTGIQSIVVQTNHWLQTCQPGIGVKRLIFFVLLISEDTI